MREAIQTEKFETTFCSPSCSAKARVKKYGLPWGKLWTDAEVQKLKKLYPNRTNEEIGKELGRTSKAVKKKADELGLKKSNAFFARMTTRSLNVQGKRTWSEEDLELLRKLYPTTPTDVVAEKLHRTVKAVISKKQELGLKKSIIGGLSGNRYKALGREKEEETIKFLQSKGWILIERGGHQTAFDAIMEYNGKRYGINLKYGDKFTETKLNIERLFETVLNPVIIFTTKEGKHYFLEIRPLN